MEDWTWPNLDPIHFQCGSRNCFLPSLTLHIFTFPFISQIVTHASWDNSILDGIKGDCWALAEVFATDTTQKCITSRGTECQRLHTDICNMTVISCLQVHLHMP